MKIEPKYVTFEQAKWLKENGFDEGCDWAYDKCRILYRSKKKLCKNIFNNSLSNQFSAPEQWMVVEWFRIKYKIWIQISAEVYENGINYLWQYIKLKDVSISYGLYGDNGEYNTPQAAYSAVFNYILKNDLI